MGIRYSVNEVFFKKWSHTMAYVLGFLYADGSLELSPSIRGKYLRVSSTEYEHIKLIRNILESKHTIVQVQKKSHTHKDGWLLRIGNSKLYDSLTNFGLKPNKSLTMALPNIPPSFLCSFTRGYFDGDGCVYIEKRTNMNGKLVPIRLRTIFTSGSKIFISSLLADLSKMDSNFKNGKIYTSNKNRLHRLIFPTSTSMLLYVFMYSNAGKDLLLKPKFDKFNGYFDYRKSKLNEEIKKIRKKSAQW